MTDNQVDVKITAQTSDFSDSIDKANTSFKGLSTTINAHAGLIREHLNLGKEAIQLFAEAFVVEKIREWGEVLGEAAEQIERTAQITGLSTDEVQKFNFAVDMSGGNAESASTTLERLERNMAEAGDKTSKAALAFSAMGIKTREADGSLRPLNGVLGDLAQYFSSTANGAAKTALAMEVMGRGGAQLIPVLNKGKEGLDELNKALDDTNSKMSGSQIEKFAKLDESLKLLNKSWEGFKLAISEYFEPAYQLIVKGITEIIQWVTKGIKAVNDFTDSLSKMGYGKYAPQNQPKEEEDKPDAATPQTQKQIEDAKKLSEQLLKLKKTQDEQFLGLDQIRNEHLLEMGYLNNEQFLQNELKLAERKALIDAEYYQQKKQQAKNDDLALAKIEEERLNADIKNSENIAKIRAKISEDSIKNYQTMYNSITKNAQSMTEKLIRGTITFKEAFRQMCADMIVEFAKMQVANVAKALWAAAMGKGISFASAIAERGANAVKAASATYASVSSIPYIGWIMAPIAAAGAFAGVMAFSMPSAEGGWGEVPSDGMAMIHKKEMVLPAPLAERVRNMTDDGNSGNNYHFNISAIDGNSVKDMFMKHGSSIVQALNNQSRNLNPRVSK